MIMLERLPSRVTDMTVFAIAAPLLLPAGAALAEGPMTTDDAGTLAKGAMKIEAVWSKDDRAKAGEWLFGISPVEHLELEVAFVKTRDDAAAPATTMHGIGFGAKWIPLQNDVGWSLGARFDYGYRHLADPQVDTNRNEHAYTLTSLATWRHASGHVLHANLGVTEHQGQGERHSATTWGIGYEYPLGDRMQLTSEVFGGENSRPDRAIGLRYELLDGLKLSAAAGRGNDRSFGQVGAAWEF